MREGVPSSSRRGGVGGPPPLVLVPSVRGEEVCCEADMARPLASKAAAHIPRNHGFGFRELRIPTDAGVSRARDGKAQSGRIAGLRRHIPKRKTPLSVSPGAPFGCAEQLDRPGETSGVAHRSAGPHPSSRLQCAHRRQRDQRSTALCTDHLGRRDPSAGSAHRPPRRISANARASAGTRAPCGADLGLVEQTTTRSADSLPLPRSLGCVARVIGQAATSALRRPVSGAGVTTS